MTGAQAHEAGVPISECPYLPADPDGMAWRTDWIRAEAMTRYEAGTYGATDDEYRAGGLHPPARRPSDDVPVSIIAISLTPEQLATLEEAFRVLGEACRSIVRQFVDSGVDEVLRNLTAMLDESKAHGASGKAPCPRHGPRWMKGGTCRRCQREADRRYR